MTDTELSQLKTVLVHEIGHDVSYLLDDDWTDLKLCSVGEEEVHIFGFQASAPHTEGYWDDDWGEDVSILLVKPYLRPLSSMAEKEKNIYHSMLEIHYGYGGYVKEPENEYSDTPQSYLWLLKNHFDVFYLIENGLALRKETQND